MLALLRDDLALDLRLCAVDERQPVQAASAMDNVLFPDPASPVTMIRRPNAIGAPPIAASVTYGAVRAALRFVEDGPATMSRTWHRLVPRSSVSRDDQAVQDAAVLHGSRRSKRPRSRESRAIATETHPRRR